MRHVCACTGVHVTLDLLSVICLTHIENLYIDLFGSVMQTSHW